MATSNACWGIEVGSGGIKAVKLLVDGEGVRVAEIANLPHKRVLSMPDLNVEDAIRVAMGAFVNQYDLGKARVAVSVPGNAAFARFAKLPPVEPRQLPKIVRFEAEQQIPFSLEEVEWDYQTFQSPDSPDVEVGIFAATKERIREQLRLYGDFGLVPDIVTLSPIAVYNAMAYDLAFDERTPGTVIVDVGTSSTDIVIAEAGRVWVRTFPLGGHAFTQAIVDQFSVSYAKAEKIKREVHKSKSARHVLQAMRPVFSDLGQEIQRSIGYYQSLHSDSDLQRVVGVGATFQLQGIRKALQQQVQLPVQGVDEFSRAKVEGPLAATVGEQAGQLVTAYGLALQGLEFATLEANLMPAAIVREAVWRRKVPWFATAAGVGVLAGGAMFIRPFMDQAAVDAFPQPPIIQQVVSQGESLRREAGDVVGSQRVDRRAANLITLADGRRLYPLILNDVQSMLLRAAELNAQDTDNAVDPPVITVESLQTEYVPPVDPNQADRRGGGGDQGPQNPQVRVTLRAFTDRPDATEFIVNAVDRWLRANAQREGVPYQLVLSERTWRATRTLSASDLRGETSGGGGIEIVSAPESEVASRPVDRRRASRPVDRRDVRDAPPSRMSPTPEPGGREPRTVGDQPSRPTPPRSGGALGTGDLNNRFPIPRPVPDVPDGTTRTFFEASWVVELASGEGGGQ